MRMWPNANATLVALMKQQGMGPTRMAARVPANASMISHLRNGRVPGCSDELARAISEVLGVPVETLFDPSTATVSSPISDDEVA